MWKKDQDHMLKEADGTGGRPVWGLRSVNTVSLQKLAGNHRPCKIIRIKLEAWFLWVCCCVTSEKPLDNLFMKQIDSWVEPSAPCSLSSQYGLEDEVMVIKLVTTPNLPPECSLTAGTGGVGVRK